VPKSDLAAVSAIDAVPNILDVVCQVTGLGFAAVARVTEEKWTALAVLDRIGFGLEPGGELELTTTICHEIRQSRVPVVIDSVRDDPIYAKHPTPKIYGFQSYISVPIILRDGTFFGTLCAIDPAPAAVSKDSTVKTFELFAQLLALHLESREQAKVINLELQDERRSADMRDQFIAVLGHDLRNPLAALAAGMDVLGRGELPDRKRQVLELMQASYRRMLALTNDILDFARGQLGSGVPLKAREDPAIAEVLDHVVDELRTVHAGHEILARIDLPHPVYCDSARLAQLLSNLLANALTHGDPTQPVNLVIEDDGSELRIEVANGGPEIEPSQLARLFHPFENGPKSTHDGLGLGLYIAAEIARAHGGTIKARSSSELTVFEVRLPSRARERTAA
jgi:signal transduction histidine kinase